MSEPISASPANEPADAATTAANDNHAIGVERVFVVLTAMTEYFATRWDATDELRALRRERLMLHYGWTPETIARFKLGFDDGTVVEHLKMKGFTPEEILSTGAFRIDTYNRIVSRFEGRIVFPYLDEHGTTLYATARETSLTPRWMRDGKDATPKYVKLSVHKDGEEDGISPAVKNVIFSTHEVGKRDVGIIAEGVADAISAAQAGYAVRSPVTTTFKADDAEEIDRLTSAWKTILLIPDMEMNESGINGAIKTAKIFIAKGRDIRIGILPHEDIKAAAEHRVEEFRRARISEGKAVTDAEVKKVGDWKIDLNEMLAAPGASKAIMSRLAELKASVNLDAADDKANFEGARTAALQALKTVRAERQETLRVLVDQAAPALDIMIGTLPSEPTPADWTTCIPEVTETIATIKSDAEREAWIDKLKARVGGRITSLRKMVEQSSGDDMNDAPDAENPLTPILSRLKFFRVLTGRVFTVVDGLALPVDGEDFAAWVAHTCFTATKTVVGPTAIKDAIRAVVGVSTKLPLGIAPIRYAYGDDGSIWIDLADADNHFVHVTATNIKIENRCPIAFYRPAGTGSMPVPELIEKPEAAAAILGEYFDFLAVGTSSRAGLFGIIISAMRPMEQPETGALTRYTVGVINGEHGTGKSTRQMFVRRTIDPREPASMKMPDKVDDLCIYSENSAAVSLDNQSTLSGMMSDALCRVATGDGNVKRSLFTTRDLAVFRGSRPILVNGITDVVTRDDLLDRSLIVHVEKPESGKTDDELETEFQAMWPRVFGAFCFCLMEAIATHADTTVDRTIRMLQAARWAAAAEIAGGFESGDTEKAYLTAREEAVAIASDDPFVTAVLGVVGHEWKNTMSKLTEDLIARVEERDPISGKPTKKIPKDFPTTVPKVRSMLQRKMPALRALGLKLVREEERTATSSKTTFLHFTRDVVVEPTTATTDGTNGMTSPSVATTVTADTSVPTLNGINGVAGYAYAMGADDPESPLYNV